MTVLPERMQVDFSTEIFMMKNSKIKTNNQLEMHPQNKDYTIATILAAYVESKLSLGTSLVEFCITLRKV